MEAKYWGGGGGGFVYCPKQFYGVVWVVDFFFWDFSPHPLVDDRHVKAGY